jgi:hypothetical protein
MRQETGEVVRLPPPAALVIEERPDGFFLVRISADGEFAGDTWHRDLAEAFGQAEFEFSQPTEDWQAVPETAQDPIGFLRTIGER